MFLFCCFVVCCWSFYVVSSSSSSNGHNGGRGGVGAGVEVKVDDNVEIKGCLLRPDGKTPFMSMTHIGQHGHTREYVVIPDEPNVEYQIQFTMTGASISHHNQYHVAIYLDGGERPFWRQCKTSGQPIVFIPTNLTHSFIHFIFCFGLLFRSYKVPKRMIITAFCFELCDQHKIKIRFGFE